MRDILFRGKRLSDNEWIYGYLADDDSINNINEVATPNEEVYRDTVGEYTGYHDINNKRIFEGDIVKDVNTDMIGYVAWLRQEAGWCIVWRKYDSRMGHRHRGGSYECDESLKVVGNMEDNFEMIPWLNDRPWLII